MPSRENYGDKFLLIAEEVEICKRLSSNDEKVRKKGVLALKHLLKKIDKKSVVDINDFKRLWSGIFNFIWMSDKPLIQEENIESICELIHILRTHETAMMFVREFFNALSIQWNRISHHRTDKFLMFIRRFLRQILILLKNSSWNIEKIEAFSNELYVALQVLPFELVLHLNDIFIEELAKVSDGQLSTSALISLLKGYLECIATMKPSMSIISNINSNIFCALSRQLKLCLKQKAILSYNPDDQDVERYENDSENPNENAYDPRPGNVNVYLPYIEFAEDVLADFIEEYQKKPFLHRKVKNILSQIINTFRSISKLRRTLNNPIVIEKVATEKRVKPKKKRNKLAPLIKQSCKRLEREEAEYDRRTDERIYKKLVQMSDIVQVPVGKKKVMVSKNSEKSYEKQVGKRKRSGGNDSWTVTVVAENTNEAESHSPKLNQNWMVTEAENRGSHISNENESTVNVDLKNKVKMSKSPAPVVEDGSVECKRPRLRRESRESPKLSNRKSSVEQPESSTKKLDKISASHDKRNVDKSPAKDESEEKTSDISNETSSPIMSPNLEKLTNEDVEKNDMISEGGVTVTTMRKTRTMKNKEPSDKRGRRRGSAMLEDVPELTTLSDRDITKTKRRRTEVDKLSENNRDTTPPPTVTTSPQTPSMRTRSRMRSRAETITESVIVNEQMVGGNDSKTTTDSKEMKKAKRRVSFDTKPSTITYQAEETTKEDTNVSREVIVPMSVVKDRPKLLKEGVSYEIIDLGAIHKDVKSEDTSNASTSESSNWSNEEEKGEILDTNNPAWKSVPQDDVEALVSKAKDDSDMEFDISYLFASPEQKRKGRRSVRKSIQSGELKRSERLANKTKRVEFNRKDTFQG